MLSSIRVLLLLSLLITSPFLPVLLLMLFRPLVPSLPPRNGIKASLLTLSSSPLVLILLKIDIGFCKLLGGVIGNYNNEQWCSSMADAVVAKAFSRIDAVFDALSSPDVSHQISYHILSSTLPSYLMHTLRITPPAILLPILDRFHLRLFRAALNCFGICPAAFDSLPTYLRRAVSFQLFLPCRVGGFKLPDLPMLAPIAYAASISQSLPHPAHHMFLEIVPTIDRLRFLQRAFPTTSHSNPSSLPIPLDKVLPMCSPLDDVTDPISFSQFLYHYSDISSPYLSEFTQIRGRSKHDAHLQNCFASLLNRVSLFYWLSSIDSSAPLRYCVRIRCQGGEASIPLTCPPIDRLYRLTDAQWDLMAQRRAGLVDTDISIVNPLQRSYVGRSSDKNCGANFYEAPPQARKYRPKMPIQAKLIGSKCALAANVHPSYA
eukprot:g52968.t1